MLDRSSCRNYAILLQMEVQQMIVYALLPRGDGAARPCAGPSHARSDMMALRTRPPQSSILRTFTTCTLHESLARGCVGPQASFLTPASQVDA